jgi:hypothetical protein
MLPEIAGIFERHQAGQARSQQVHIGPSEVGHPCDRHLAYKVHHIPHAVPPHLKWAALVGTWGHAGAEQAMREENERLGRERYLVEKRAYIEPDLVPSGSTDVYDTDFDEVDDWKFVGESSAAKYRAKGAGQLYTVQAMLYGLGWKRMGRDPKSIRIIFLPRWSNDLLRDAVEVAYEFDEKIALDALDRLRVIRAAGEFTKAGMAPWTEIKANKSDCRFCPWLRRKTASEPEADETGCLGHLNPSADLEGLAGVERVSSPSTSEQLAQLIGNAQHPDALTALWRNAHDVHDCKCRAGEPCGKWLPAHSKLAGERRAALTT